jgi:CHAT domain-containing protein
VLRFGAAPIREAEAPIVAANPDFDLFGPAAAQPPVRPLESARHSRELDANSLYFPPLDATAEEGWEVARLLGVKAWMEDEVLEGSLRSHRSPWILHLATHGFFLPNEERMPNPFVVHSAGHQDEVPNEVDAATTPFARLAGAENPLLRSGLAFAGANTWARGGPLPLDAEDGLLTAEDVSGLDLLDTELVVLSACETGLGDTFRGEGVFGLRRAFTIAGAKTLVMSLWRVPDEQTRSLIADFYSRLIVGDGTGPGRSEALRTAQLELKRQPAYSDPYFWGAFICQGDPGQLGRRVSPSTGRS